jgi:hypothetical protein
VSLLRGNILRVLPLEFIVSYPIGSKAVRREASKQVNRQVPSRRSLGSNFRCRVVVSLVFGLAFYKYSFKLANVRNKALRLERLCSYRYLYR